MSGTELDVNRWAQQEFGLCDLGDVRRTRRLVKFAAQIAAKPDGSTPAQTEKWSDLKAGYRLIDGDQATLANIGGPHWQSTKNCSPGKWMIVCDTTENDFGKGNQAAGLGPLGRGTGRGFLLHSGLMIDPTTGKVHGLAGQVVRYRRPAPKGETGCQRLKRSRESEVWGQLAEQIGPPPEGARFVFVCDRGADDFEFMCRLLLGGQDWLIRVARANRKVKVNGKKMSLEAALEQMPAAGTYELTYRPAGGGERTAKMEVRFGLVCLLAPRFRSPWLKASGVVLISTWVVMAREVHPPSGVEPLEWVLFSSTPVESFEDACERLDEYGGRWVIEEFHKAIKTGCRAEERQYRTAARLEAIVALLSIVAVRLLQLRHVARTAPDTPVQDVVPPLWVSMLETLRRRPITTVRDFYRQLAGLGGHMLRKGDGEPGWLTLWRGFEKLHLAVRAVRDHRIRCG